MKQWRGLATRYDTLGPTYRAGAVLRAIIQWLNHLLVKRTSGDLFADNHLRTLTRQKENTTVYVASAPVEVLCGFFRSRRCHHGT